MGGQIAIIRKVNDKIEPYEGWTNSFSAVTKDLKFYQNPASKAFDNWTQNRPRIQEFCPLDYGLFVIDYDSKTIYNCNGYSKYIDFEKSGVSLDEMDRQKLGILSGGIDKRNFKSPIHEFFNKGLLCLHSILITGNINTPTIKHEHTYANIQGSKFKTAYDVLDFAADNRWKEMGNDQVIIFSVEIDLKKMGWKYYEFEEDSEGWMEYYKQLVKDGFTFTQKDLEAWSDHVDRGEDEGNHISFKDIIKMNNRKEKIDEVIPE